MKNDVIVYEDSFIEQSFELYQKIKKGKKDLQFSRFDNFLAFRHSLIRTKPAGFQHILKN